MKVCVIQLQIGDFIFSGISEPTQVHILVILPRVIIFSTFTVQILNAYGLTIVEYLCPNMISPCHGTNGITYIFFISHFKQNL